MSSTLQNLMEKQLGDGARSTKFDAVMIIPWTSEQFPKPDTISTLIKTAEFPGKTHTPMTRHYHGIAIPVRGQNKYSQRWSCTFYMTEDHKIKQALEGWMTKNDIKTSMHEVTSVELISASNISRGGADNYFQTITMYQYDFDEKAPTVKYTLFNAFPVEISPISVSYEGISNVLELNATFSYTHFTMETLKGPAGNFIDDLMNKTKGLVSGAITGAMDSVSNALGNALSDMFKDESSIKAINEQKESDSNIITSDLRLSTDKLNKLNKMGGTGANYMPTAFMKEK